MYMPYLATAGVKRRIPWEQAALRASVGYV